MGINQNAAVQKGDERMMETLENKGFSLVELSIVLVIIGLLTGGILSGQSLIRAAELRAVTTEYSQYKTAAMTFRDKYLALPGDMKNATKFWGAAHATPATCITTAGTGTQTCDGNGNGRITDTVTASTHQEFMTFWQHLANAGLITGQYTGMVGPSNPDDSIIGTNVPASRLTNGGWFVQDDLPNGTLFYPVALRHNFRLGGNNPGHAPVERIFSPEEMWGIDTKIDDGKPGMGAVTSYLSSTWISCATSDVPGTAEYRLTASTKECILILDTGF